MLKTVSLVIIICSALFLTTAFAEDDCATRLHKVRTDILTTDSLSDDQKVKLLQMLVKANEHCLAGDTEEAMKELRKVETEEVYAEAFTEADT